jgi:hypothetical protein
MSRMLRRRSASEQVRNAEMNFAFERERAKFGHKLPNAGATPSPSESDSEEREYSEMYGRREIDGSNDGHAIMATNFNFRILFILVMLFFISWNLVSTLRGSNKIDEHNLTTQRLMNGDIAFVHADIGESNGLICTEIDETPRYWIRLGRSIAPPARCTSFDLSKRKPKLRDGGVHALVKGLKKMKSEKLQHLALIDQGITSKGASNLANLIVGSVTQPTGINASSFTLDLRGNLIDVRGYDELRSAVEVVKRVSWMKVQILGGKSPSSSSSLFPSTNTNQVVDDVIVDTPPHRSDSSDERSLSASQWRLASYEVEEVTATNERPKQNPNVAIGLAFGCLFLSVFFLSMFSKSGTPPALADRRNAVRYE